MSIFASKLQLFSRGLNIMKVSLLKLSRKKEVIKRIELSELAEMIRKSPDESKVFSLRLNYQFYKPQRLPDGQIALDNQQHTVSLPESQNSLHDPSRKLNTNYSLMLRAENYMINYMAITC